MVRVLWADSQDHAEKWVDEEDAITWGQTSCDIISIGFLISKTPKYITLGADWDDIDKDYGRVTKISTSMLVSIENLEVVNTHNEENPPPPTLIDSPRTITSSNIKD
jgi:hypothetical protein